MNTSVIPSGFNAMSTAITVTMDDVVSAFVSKYETQLFTRKKELSAEVARTQTEIKELRDAVSAKIDTQKHNTELPLGLVATAEKTVSLDFEKGKAFFTIEIRAAKGTANPYSYRDDKISITQYEVLDTTDVADYNALTALLESQQTALADILDKIKSVARKEREVRGRIAMRKIEESGYSSLLDDAQLLQLVQL